MWDIELTSIIPIARHAYIAVGLAVKTSRPHFFKDLLGVPLKKGAGFRYYKVITSIPNAGGKGSIYHLLAVIMAFLQKVCVPISNPLFLTQIVYQKER